MSKINKKWLFIILLSIVGIIGLVYFIFFRGGSTSEESSEITPTVIVEEEPTPTPEESINKEEVKIKVLNGSGLVGEAGKVQKILEGLGYKVESTGNAGSYDFKETTIQTKEKVPLSVLNAIKRALETDYTVTTSQLDSDNDSDIIVTIGARKVPATPTTQLTPTGKITTSPSPTSGTTTTPSPSPTKGA